MKKGRILTPEQEESVFLDDETRKKHGLKSLSVKYNVCETTLREAIKRARARREGKIP